ncbi:hypothetical protein [Stenotrophomonas sp. RAC2]|uniref:hypothetical protein n=1 Tax=Stenotrophomonas sp. RAC2 TaxID=3064902 RepID=UPI00271677FB|nr:hypothetical protein [Stenotrophomonas sp. RAC2]MDV9043836.1 hypothetical protein [Stenotrophomonas sp. RAC2]
MRDARIGYHRRVNLPGLLLRWMLLVALVLNAPALALASSSNAMAADADHCAAPHSAGMAGCCDEAASTVCQSDDCECPPACPGMLATLSGTPASPWREAPLAASAQQRAPPPVTDPLRPPIG